MKNPSQIKTIIRESVKRNLIKESSAVIGISLYVLLGLAYERMRFYQKMSESGLPDVMKEIENVMRDANNIIPKIKKFAEETYDEELKTEIKLFEIAAKRNFDAIEKAGVFGIEDFVLNAAAPKIDVIVSNTLTKLSNAITKFTASPDKMILLRKLGIKIPYLGLYLLPLDFIYTEHELKNHFDKIDALDITGYLANSLNGFKQILKSKGIIE